MRKSKKKEILNQLENLVNQLISYIGDGYDQGKLKKEEYDQLMSNKAVNLFLKCHSGNKSLINRTKVVEFEDALSEIKLWKCEAIDVLWANHIFYEE